MRIESISPAPDTAGRFTVKLDTGARLKLYVQTIQDQGLYPGMEVNEEQLSAIRERNGAVSARMRAVRILSATSVSRRDLEQRLVKKGEDPAQAREAVEWMGELNLLDDQETARQVVRQCIYKGYGKARAKQALYEKKLPRELWEEALEGYPDQEEHIEKYLRAKLRDPEEPREVKRAVDGLLRRGHSYGTIRRVLEALGAQMEDE